MARASTVYSSRYIFRFQHYNGYSFTTQTWWRHQMETFSTLLALCAGISPVTVEFPSQRPVTRSFDVFFGLRLENGWVNNRDAGDLRRHCAHCVVTVMKVWFLWTRGTSLARYFRYICVLYIDFKAFVFFVWHRFLIWSIKQILWWINMHKSKNFGEVTTTEVKIIKTAETCS